MICARDLEHLYPQSVKRPTKAFYQGFLSRLSISHIKRKEEAACSLWGVPSLLSPAMRVSRARCTPTGNAASTHSAPLGDMSRRRSRYAREAERPLLHRVLRYCGWAARADAKGARRRGAPERRARLSSQRPPWLQRGSNPGLPKMALSLV